MSTTPQTVSIPFPAAGYHALTDWELLSVTGRDRVDFLKGLLTNSIKRVSVGGGNTSLFLTVKGRIQGEAVLAKFEDNLLLLTPPQERQGLLDFLNHYHVIEKVSFSELDNSIVPYLLVGNELPQSLAKAGLDFPESGQGLQLSEWLEASDTPIWGTRYERMGRLPMLIVWAPQDWTNKVEAKLSELGLEALTHEQVAQARISGGWYSLPEMKELLVHEANLQETHVDFKKGCFVGQEVVARTEHRGKANKRLVALSSEAGNSTEVGASIHNEAGKEVGQIVAAWPGADEKAGTIYRALLRVQAWEEAATLSAASNKEEAVPLQKIEFQW